MEEYCFDEGLEDAQERHFALFDEVLLSRLDSKMEEPRVRGELFYSPVFFALRIFGGRNVPSTLQL